MPAARTLVLRLLLPLTLLLAVRDARAAAPASADVPPGPRHGAQLSAVGEQMLRAEIAAGRTLTPGALRRLGLDPAVEPPEAPAEAGLAPAAPLGTVALETDTQVNDKTFDATCGTCSNRPLVQSETTIAALGSLLLAGWNDTQGFCTGGAIQGYGYSVDGGATWVDAGDPPALPGGGRYRGDPVHSVNRATGDFYICGLYEGGISGSGIALARGHFSGGAFLIDDNRQIAVGGSNFLDKEWLAVDSLSGNLYVTYSNFLGGSISRIEMIRSTTNGATWDAPVVINDPLTNGDVQGSRPVVGPDGELYVAWYEYGYPQSHMKVRRSDDFGQSFGAIVTVCDFYENYYSGAPGFRRAFGIALPGIAVDASPGPHRGRVYVVWDEAVNFEDAPFSSATAISEVENNGFFQSATPFTVGDVLRTTIDNSSDLDLFRFDGLQGQTVFFRTDSATAYPPMRMICGSDTSSVGSYRSLTLSNYAVVFTLPADGTYFLQISASTASPISLVIGTAFDTPSLGERARDHRDRFVSHSDDGASWSVPALLNDDDPWFDGEFPEVTVDGSGAVHCFWHDFRDDATCGAESYEYMVSSGDGGDTWGANRRVSDEISFWSSEACGSANQGDYQGIASDGWSVFPCWADSRLGDPDVYVDRPTFRHASLCPAGQEAPAGSPLMIQFTLENQGSVAGSFEWSLEDDTGWLTGASPGLTGSAALGPSGTQVVVATLDVPAQCSPLADELRFVSADPSIPGRLDTCATSVHCVSPTGAPVARGASLFLSDPRPNPGARGRRIRFGLSREGPVRLEIFGANGGRVRSLIAGRRPAGEHEAVWDGRDERGRRVPAGVFYLRLRAEGRSLQRPVVVLP